MRSYRAMATHPMKAGGETDSLKPALWKLTQHRGFNQSLRNGRTAQRAWDLRRPGSKSPECGMGGCAGEPWTQILERKGLAPFRLSWREAVQIK